MGFRLHLTCATIPFLQSFDRCFPPPELKGKKRTGKNDLKFGVVNIRNQCWRVEVFGFSAYSWICLRCLITLYHGKSPLNHNLVNILYFFPTTLKANRSIGGWVFISFFFWVCYDINKAKCIQGVLWCFFLCSFLSMAFFWSSWFLHGSISRVVSSMLSWWIKEIISSP